MGNLRTRETSQKYTDYRIQGGLDGGCRLCDAQAVKEYRFWKVSINNFPYDRIAEVHHMLLPIRHTDEAGLTEEERQELLAIKDGYVQHHYEFMIEASQKHKSIPAHFHLHLIVAKEFEDK